AYLTLRTEPAGRSDNQPPDAASPFLPEHARSRPEASIERRWSARRARAPTAHALRAELVHPYGSKRGPGFERITVRARRRRKTTPDPGRSSARLRPAGLRGDPRRGRRTRGGSRLRAGLPLLRLEGGRARRGLPGPVGTAAGGVAGRRANG